MQADRSKLQFELNELKNKLTKVVVKVKLMDLKSMILQRFFIWYWSGMLTFFSWLDFSFFGFHCCRQGISSVERAIIINEAKGKDPGQKKLKLLVEG